MGKNKKTNRRANRPMGMQRPFKPIPVITEKYHSKPVEGSQVTLSLLERLKEWGSKIRRLFGRKKKRRIEFKTVKSQWNKEDRPQHVIDLSIHKAKIKARNRRNRKQARKLHQRERRIA